MICSFDMLGITLLAQGGGFYFLTTIEKEKHQGKSWDCHNYKASYWSL